MEETIAGPVASMASHCASKLGSTTLPASGRTCGPVGEKVSHRRFRGGIALGRRIGDPEIELKATVCAGTNVGGPLLDRVRLHHQRAAAAEPAGIGDRNGQRGRTGARHRRHQDRHTEIELFTKHGGAGEGRVLRHTGDFTEVDWLVRDAAGLLVAALVC